MGVHQGIKASLGERCERYNTLQKVCIPIADANSTTMTPNRAPRLSEGGSWQAASLAPGAAGRLRSLGVAIALSGTFFWHEALLCVMLPLA